MSMLIADRDIDTANLLAAVADEFLYACLLLMLGETERYRRFCRKLVARPGQPEDNYAAIALARICAVGNSDAVAPDRLVKWASAGVERLGDAASLHVLGLTLFRAGRYAEAIETLQQSNAARGWSQQAKSQNWLVLAMARFCLHDVAEAQHCLNTARQLITDGRPTLGNQPHELAAADRIELSVLLREAEALIQNVEVAGTVARPTSNEQCGQSARRVR